MLTIHQQGLLTACEDSSGNIIPGDWRSVKSAVIKGFLDTLTRFEAIDTHLRQEEQEMTLSHALTVLRGKYLDNCNMS